jgi:dimethylsulfone monooxygenase
MRATELMEYRREHIPVFNDNKTKLGIFGQNCSNGCTISHAETTF